MGEEQPIARRESPGGRSQRFSWRIVTDVVDGRVRLFCGEEACRCLGHRAGDGADPSRELVGDAFTVGGLVHAVAVHRMEWGA